MKNICEKCCMPCCYNRRHEKEECSEFSPYVSFESLKKIKKSFKRFLKALMSRKYHIGRKDKYRILKVSIWTSFSAFICYLISLFLPINSYYILIIPTVNIMLFSLYCYIEGTVD